LLADFRVRVSAPLGWRIVAVILLELAHAGRLGGVLNERREFARADPLALVGGLLTLI